MYVFFSSLLIFVALCVASLFTTYLFTVLSQQSGRHPEPAINNVVMVQFQLLTSTVTDAIGDMISGVTDTAFGFAANIFQNAKQLLQLTIVALILLEISGNTDIVLRTGDTSWRCIVQPLFQNVLLSVGQILRVIYDFFIPMYNYNYVVTSQATKGSIAIAIKCDFSSTLVTVKLIVETFIASFRSLFSWTGVGAMSTENNIFMNELPVTDVVDSLQHVLSHQQNITECVCEGLKDVIDIGFTVVRQKELPMAINHAVNVPVSLIQTVFQLLPMFGPKFPSLTKPLYHWNGAFYYIMKYFDRVLEEGLKKSIRLFVDDFDFQGVPEEFIFTTLSRAVMSGTHTLHTLYRTAMHIMLPIPYFITNTDYMMKAMRFDQAAEQFDLMMLNLANNGFWFMEIARYMDNAIARSLATGNEVKIVGIPAHVRLVCEPSDKWTVAAACTPYLITTAASNTFFIATSLIGELLWKSIFTQEQNVLRTLQRYDGPSYPRDKFIGCEYRKENTWDMTTDSSKCKCDIPKGYRQAEFTEEYPFGVPNYDPFCGQPSLNANVFSNWDRALKLAKRTKIPDLPIQGVGTYGLLNLEMWRIGIKTLLNLPDIILFKFFHHKVNCGYGVSEEALEEWWIDKGESIQDCLTPKPGYMYYLANRNEYNPNACEPIHDSIRFDMCRTVSNFQNKKDLCTDENKEGCQCNIGLPLEDTSLCSCIFNFPDTPQEISQTAFTNKVLDKHYAASPHWCQTHHAEWLFYILSDVGLVIDKFFSKLHPAYDSAENSYCEDMSYELASTNILAYNNQRWNEQKTLYDSLAMTYSSKSCKLYGSHDFICSASMTVRYALNLIVSEVRELVMTLFELLGGSANGITVNLGNRLCDLQRTAAGLSSTISSIFPVGIVSNEVRSGFAKIVFVQLDLPIELLNMLNHAVQFVENILRGTAGFGSSITQPVFNFIIDEINIIFNWFELFLDGFEDLFEGIHRGAGAIFRTFKIILNIFRQFLSDAAIEMLSLVLKVFGGVIELFTGGGLYNEFFADLWRLITKFLEMMLKNAGKVLDAVLSMLGPIGQFIRELSGEICVGLQDAICALSFGGMCDLGCPGAGPSSPPAPAAAIGDAVGGFFDDIFGRRLHSSMHNLPRILYDEIDWNGVSECDMAVHAYRDFNFTDLRPMERIQLLQCVEQRALAVNMGKQLELDLPHDLVYNWKRKYVMMYELMTSGIIYLQYTTGDTNATEMLNAMKHASVDTNLYIPFWNKVRSYARQFTLISHLDNFVHTLFHSFDKDIKTSDTGWGNIYRIYKHSSTAAKAIYNHSQTVDLHYDFTQAGKALTNINMTWKNPIPEHFSMQGMKRVTLRATKTANPYKLKSRNFILRAAGLNTDITPCEEQADTNMCVNCLVLDNFFNTVINEGKRMGQFYEYTYVPVVIPSFIEYFNDEEKETRAKAWRDDMAMMMEKAAKKAAEDVSDFASETTRNAVEGLEEEIEASQRGYVNIRGRHKLFSNHTEPLTVWQKATKDWDTLIFKLEWRNNATLLEAIEKFLTVTDDSYVPFFARSASWYVTYPFAGDCPMDIIYGTYPGHETTSKRLDLMEASFGYMTYFVIGLFLFDWFTGLPVFALISPFILYILAFIFVLVTYGWIWPCFPNVPNMLVDDIFAFLNDRIFPNCFCQYFPGLATSCNLDNCYLCSIQTSYLSCPDNIPELKELGIFWAPLTWLKVNFPEVLVFIYDNPPFLWLFRRLDNLDSMFQNAIYKTPLTDIENDCLRLHVGDMVVFILVCYVGSKALQFAVPLATRAVQHGLKLVTMVIGLFYTMAVSIELSTLSNAGKNTYQQDGF
jgi:hypothetical protein